MITDLPGKEKPHIISYLELCEYHGWPTEIAIYEKAMADHPEYFPDEIEHREKWMSIPEHVHQSCTNEWIAERDKILQDQPHRGKGLVFFIDNPDAYEEHANFEREREAELDAMEQRIHDKYYKPYNIQLKKWK